MDEAARRYQRTRIEHWDRMVTKKCDEKRIGAQYQELLKKYFQFAIPAGLNVLELGCGTGDLLAAVKPTYGVGIDFSSEMIRKASQRHPHLHFVQADAQDLSLNESFDVIILSDLINDVWDAQTLFENLRRFTHARTRIIINFFNNLWRAPLSAVKYLGLGADVLPQNWFAPNDVKNLLELAGFDVIDVSPKILWPLKTKWIAALLNQYTVNFIPFQWIALTNFMIARPLPEGTQMHQTTSSVSVIVPARNESGNIYNIIKRVPKLGSETEIVFVEGNSTDDTYEKIKEAIEHFPDKKCRLLRQTGKGKGDAVRLGFQEANGDILLILDADLTVPPEDLPRFVGALEKGKGEFINGVRLVYPMEDKAMRFFNILGNKFFSLAFTWLLGQPIKDTLCGTKVMFRHDYDAIAKNRDYFGNFDPFGDFDLLFGAAKLNLKITEMPIRYRERTYGDTNINRWRHGWLLLKMVMFAARKIKFL